MATTTRQLAFLAIVAVLLLQASSRSEARHHHHPHKPAPDDPCRDSARHKKDGHRCSSPAVSRHGGTPATMTVNGFQRGEDGGGPAACDGRFHSDREMVAALSTGWYAGGRRCHRPIRITSARTGRSVVARVVDECDSRHGCKNDIVDTSKAVWEALGLDTNVGEVPVTWSDA